MVTLEGREILAILMSFPVEKSNVGWAAKEKKICKFQNNTNELKIINQNKQKPSQINYM